MAKNNEYLIEYQTNLEKLAIGELRQRANKVFGIKLSREHTKDQIIQLIMDKLSTSEYVQQAEGELKPGYARIKLSRTEGKTELPYFNCNGYFGWIPVEVEVDVPIKLIEHFNNAVEMKKKPHPEFADQYIDVMSLSYPFSVLGINPGPDPKPGREAMTERKWRPYIAFFEKFGRFPSQKLLEQYMTSSIAFNAFKAMEDNNTEE